MLGLYFNEIIYTHYFSLHGGRTLGIETLGGEVCFGLLVSMYSPHDRENMGAGLAPTRASGRVLLAYISEAQEAEK